MTHGNVYMYDSVSADQLPPQAEWVAGYADGRFANLTAIRRRFPKAHVVSIAVSHNTDALALDIENGDAVVSAAPSWVRRQHRRGIASPILYTSLANCQRLLETMAAAGHDRHEYRLWSAHYTHTPHICDQHCGLGFRGRAGATQFTDHGPAGLNCDVSLLAHRFWAEGGE